MSSENTNSSDREKTAAGQDHADGGAEAGLKSEAGPKDPIASAHEETAKWKNEYLYLRAEFDNFRKQSIKERSDLIKFGGERVIKDILEVMDNFERALSTPATAETIQNFRTGIEMTAKELKDTLSKSGVQEIACEGAPFNPLQHEAISSEPTNKVQPGHITRVFKKPYKFHDKIIRMGQVVVATSASSDKGN